VAGAAAPPDPEVVAQAKRRRFTNDYKLRILREADNCRGPGEIGALLRREGLYSSHLAGWRTQRAVGELRSGASNHRGPKPQKDPVQDRQLRELERENRRLKRKLEHAESIIAIQKKVAVFLETLPNSPPDDGNDS
jgi:transposase-like protein